MMARYFTVPIASLVFVACAARLAASPDIPVTKMAAMKCVYGPLNSNREIRSVTVYSIDGFRHAIEYTFRGKSGHVLIGDMMISGAMDGDFGWSVVSFHDESTDEGFEELDFLMKAVPDLNSRCHLTPVGDHLIPGPKPRSEWQRIDLGN
jgi:hypothetical protein